MTFEVTPELRAMMDRHPEVNWSAVFRDAIARQSRILEIGAEIDKELSDPVVQEVAAKIRKGIGERYRRALEEQRRKRSH